VTAGLLLTLFALALLDSLNPVTIAGAVFLLLTPRPVPRTLSFVAGAGLAYFAGGVLLYLGLGAVFVRVLDYLSGPWVHALLVVLGAVMVAAGIWMQRRKPKEGFGRTFKNLQPAATFLSGPASRARTCRRPFP
jgi:Sap-like sulfolipid-1-addressing protein